MKCSSFLFQTASVPASGQTAPYFSKGSFPQNETAFCTEILSAFIIPYGKGRCQTYFVESRTIPFSFSPKPPHSGIYSAKTPHSPERSRTVFSFFRILWFTDY